MSERKAFIRACTDRRRTIAQICIEFGISEKTGYKVLRRFRKEHDELLEDRSHAVLHHPFRIPGEVKEKILSLKLAHPQYGPQTIHDWLIQNEPGQRWPAASSIGEILKRNGLVNQHRKRDRNAERAHLNSSLTKASEPNLVWTADFKGQFRLGRGSGKYCYPLTVMDLNSRFILCLKGLETTAIHETRREFTRIFREYGLPRVIRTDNGVPFAQHNSIGRLGQLAFWWVRLGIKPEHIRPGRPGENGAHERFHRTLKDTATRPSSQSMKPQQERFDAFRVEYNTLRPHRSLKERRPPKHFYSSSERSFPEHLPPIVYPDGALMRRVSRCGFIKWRGQEIFISANIAGSYVGIFEVASEEGSDELSVRFANMQLGLLDLDTKTLKPEVRWIEPI